MAVVAAETKGSGDVGQEGAKNMKTTKQPKVGILRLFRFADGLDRFLMLLGTLGAIVNGAALPILFVVFGSMTDLFTKRSIHDAYVTLFKMNCSTFAEANGTTIDAILNSYDYNLLRSLITACNFTVPSPGSPDPNEFLIGDYRVFPKMEVYARYYALIGCCIILCAYLQITTFLIASHRQAQRIRVKLFETIMRQEIAWFDCHDIGELNTRLSDDVNKIQEGIGDKVSTFFQWISTFFTGLIIGFTHGWKMTVVIIACAPLLAGCGISFVAVSTAATTKELNAYAKAGAVAEEVFGAIRTVTAFGGQDKEVERYKSHLSEAKKRGIQKGMASGISLGLIFAVLYSVYALAFWYGGKLVRDREMTVGKLLTTFFAVVFASFALGNASPSLEKISIGRGAACSIWEIIDRKSEIDSFSDDGEKPAELAGHVQFQDVHFRYPNRKDVKILNGLTLEVRRGQTVALVGGSGCGKSTVIQLVQRFYDTEQGSITLDGKEIHQLNIGWLRRHIGVVSQEPVLFATTIAENISFGREGVSQEEIDQACQQANAYDFIMHLPQKFNTIVGERGSQLSGGQKQRIAIARALVRDPHLLLLDEATSALDTESEGIVQDALEKASHGRTTIVIAHRLSTIKNADLIYGIKDGVVQEAGTHEELMAKGEEGIYYKLVTRQQHTSTDSAEIQTIEEEKSLPEEQQETKQMSVHSVKHQSSGNLPKDPVTSSPSVAQPVQRTKGLGRRLMKLNAPELGFIILGCLGAFVAGAIQPAFAIVFSEILGVFGKTDLNEQKRDIELYALLLVGIGLIAAASQFLKFAAFGISGESLTMRIRALTFKALLRQEISFFDVKENSTGALCTQLATDASAVQGATGPHFGTGFQALSSLGVGIVIGFVYSWKVSLLILSFVPFIAIAGALGLRLLRGHAGAGRELLEQAGKVAVEGIENIRTVACLTKERWFSDEYRRLTEKPFMDSKRSSHLIGLSFSVSQSIIYFAYAAAFTFGAYLIDHGQLNFTNLFKVFSAIVFSAMAIGQASQLAPDYAKAQLAAAKIFSILDRVPKIYIEATGGIKLTMISGSVSFRSVRFSYPTRRTVKVLQGIDLSAEAGQTVALVGSSGCGKSTTVALLERFYDPVEGTVLLDGHDLKSLNIQWLRQQLGLVQQEPILFGTSIQENIAYGDNTRTVSMDEIIKAAQDANIHDFISKLPKGYDTKVGDKGGQLSGGQKQRVAIARALVRNPKILLLDEATSALDTESEKIVQEALDRAQQGRTSLVIAHRLSTIQNANKILVFQHGKVAEEGTHTELLAKKGLYYKLVMAQQRKKDKK